MKALRYAIVILGAAAFLAIPLSEVRSNEPAKADAKAQWKSLFNGKDLDGWKPNNKEATWTVEDGCILGTQTNGKGGDLFTTADYDNFELRFTYKVGWPANSGIWYRKNYQFDILKYANPKTFSGALYPGDKKTFAFVNPDESLENRDGWNKGVVYANGDHIIHWLNGHLIGEVHDKRFAKGAVGIQVHPGMAMKGMKIFVKTIEIRPLAADDLPTLPTTMPASTSAPAAK